MLISGVAFAAPSIKAPPTAKVGSILALEAMGNGDGHDFVTVVKKGSPEGSYDAYVYIRPGKLNLQLPGTPATTSCASVRPRAPTPRWRGRR